MRTKLPESLSIDDAVALIINLPYVPGNLNPLQMLACFTEESAVILDNAKTPEDKELYRYQLKVHENRELMAASLYDLINTEIGRIRNEESTHLELAEDSTGSEKLVTASVCAWAEEKGFHIKGWETPRHWRKQNERTYSTEYLDIIDDVIATFCEPGGEFYHPNTVPRNSYIEDYLTTKYGKLSIKIHTSIPTIIRPGLTMSTKI